MKVKVRIDFWEIQDAMNRGMMHHRELVAEKFRKQGFVVVDFLGLHYKTFQDGHKSKYKIYTVITGEVNKQLVKDPGGAERNAIQDRIFVKTPSDL